MGRGYDDRVVRVESQLNVAGRWRYVVDIQGEYNGGKFFHSGLCQHAVRSQDRSAFI